MAISDSPLGGARHFNGTSDYVTLPNDGDYDFLNMPRFTVSAWIRVTAFDLAFQAIVTKGDTAWRLQRDNTTNHLDFATTSGTTNDNENGSTSVDNNQWHHAAIVYDGARKVLYVDGTQDTIKSYTSQLDQNNESVAIGRNSESTSGGQRSVLARRHRRGPDLQYRPRPGLDRRRVRDCDQRHLRDDRPRSAILRLQQPGCPWRSDATEGAPVLCLTSFRPRSRRRRPCSTWTTYAAPR